MNDSAPTSPASSSASDSDAFNTESARLYFGPVKTPERNFVANNKRFFPPSVTPLLRRSPRLSSPRPQAPRDIAGKEIAREEVEDIDLVAQLVNAVDVDDDDAEMSNSPSGTPQRDEGELEPDEPLSALADKILHAIDNPSPPPSPPAMLRTDRYYTPDREGISDCADFVRLDATQVPARDAILSTDSGNLFLAPDSDIHTNEHKVRDLISFDSPEQVVAHKHADTSNSLLPHLMSVDDLLSNTPDFVPSSRPPVSTPPAFPAQQLPSTSEQGTELMSVDLPGTFTSEAKSSLNPLTPEFQKQNNVHPRPARDITPDLMATPLRRSSRPRKSILSTPLSQPLTMLMGPLSIARTSIKKKEEMRKLERDTADSEPEREASRQSPSRSALRRSPDKEFHRELGSLSPASTNVLSKLAFNVDSNGVDDTPSCRSKSEPPAFSFSAFMPLGEADGDMSTPVRSDGPQRILNTPKVEKSPKKFRLQTPIPNVTSDSPARRIPIEQAIAQGQLSPDKAAQLGFKVPLNAGASSATVSTPARRILVSNKPPPATRASSTLRSMSPTRQLGGQRERSVGPSHEKMSVKGKGKEKDVSPALQEVSATIKPGKLPFPIVAATSSTASNPDVEQNPLTKLPSSPVKSTLKQVTSRIPRINPKPYARKANVKASAGPVVLTLDSKSSTRHPPENPPTAKKPIRLVEAVTPTAITAAPRVKAINSTSTSLLKRKRDVEKLSPIKPHTAFLRQVPSLTTHTQTQTQPVRTPASSDQPVCDTIFVRRIVSPPPTSKPPPPSKSPQLDVSEPHGDTIINNRRIPVLPIRLERADQQDLSSIQGPVDPPGSPMKQDPGPLQPLEAPQPSTKSSDAAVEPVPASAAEPVSSGLRRTTRARRAVVQSDGTAEAASRKTARRKVASAQTDDAFSGMSITALKELTMTNTARNQHYLAAKLEMEVVRKEGLRPESPAVKIRTIVQRQQDEKDQERAERAKRRSRQGNDDEVSPSDVEVSSDVGYSSPYGDQEDVDMDNSDVDDLPQHRRGAGDDEDYVTPERPLRGITARLFDDGSDDKNRRVKWDRGLYTFVYLDEVKLGSRQTLKENMSLKGILAPTAKALRLDTLGNSLHADTPLTDLVPENVTVKKFVYDNDVVPAPQPPAPKITRSKSKRK